KSVRGHSKRQLIGSADKVPRLASTNRPKTAVSAINLGKLPTNDASARPCYERTHAVQQTAPLFDRRGGDRRKRLIRSDMMDAWSAGHMLRHCVDGKDATGSYLSDRKFFVPVQSGHSTCHASNHDSSRRTAATRESAWVLDDRSNRGIGKLGITSPR